MITWTLVATIVNSFSIFLVYYEWAFRLKALDELPGTFMFFEIVILMDLFVVFFRAYDAKEGHRGFVYSIFGTCGFCKEVKVSDEHHEKM